MLQEDFFEDNAAIDGLTTLAHNVVMEPISLGTRLKQLRQAQSLTQRELAAKIGRHQSEIYRWEKGTVRIPAEDLPVLATALEVSIDAFFVGELPEGPVIDWELLLASRRLPEEGRQRLIEFLRAMPLPLLLSAPSDEPNDEED